MCIIHQTLLELLKDRKFDISNISENDFNFIVENDITKLKLKVVRTDETKIGINYIKDLCNELDNINIKNALIIYNGSITTFAKQYNTNIDKKLEFFLENELKRNITKHYLVPKHYILTQDEKKKILFDMKIKQKYLPRCKVTDPISKYYGCNEGDIMKIIRCDDGIESVFYRLVV